MLDARGARAIADDWLRERLLDSRQHPDPAVRAAAEEWLGYRPKDYGLRFVDDRISEHVDAFVFPYELFDTGTGKAVASGGNWPLIVYRNGTTDILSFACPNAAAAQYGYGAMEYLYTATLLSCRGDMVVRAAKALLDHARVDMRESLRMAREVAAGKPHSVEMPTAEKLVAFHGDLADACVIARAEIRPLLAPKPALGYPFAKPAVVACPEGKDPFQAIKDLIHHRARTHARHGADDLW